MSDAAFPRRRARCPVPIAICLGLLAATLPASADPPARHARFCDFRPIGRYVVFIAGKEEAKAEVFQSRGAGALLVRGTTFGSPFLLCLRDRVVDKVRDEDILAQADSRCVDLAAAAVLERVGPLRQEGQDLLVDAPTLVARLSIRPNLLGLVEGEDLLQSLPEYERDAERYEVDEALLQRLQSLEKDTELTIYFGSWCHTCRRMLGRVLRVERELDDSNITFRYYGVPKPPDMYRDEAVRRDNIRKLPTGVVTKDGKPAGTIVSLAWSRPEGALGQLLLGQ
jgi:thiol-disulfide isomerase/thioredoxin